MEARRAEMELVYYRAISRARAAAARAEEAAAWWTEVATSRHPTEVATDEEEMAAEEMAAATREAAEAEEIAIGVGLVYDDAVDAARAEAARHWMTMTRSLNGAANRAVSVAAHPHWRRRSAS